MGWPESLDADGISSGTSIIVIFCQITKLTLSSLAWCWKIHFWKWIGLFFFFCLPSPGTCCKGLNIGRNRFGCSSKNSTVVLPFLTFYLAALSPHLFPGELEVNDWYSVSPAHFLFLNLFWLDFSNVEIFTKRKITRAGEWREKKKGVGK